MKKSYELFVIFSFIIMVISLIFSYKSLSESRQMLSSLIEERSADLLKIKSLENELEEVRDSKEIISENNQKYEQISSELSALKSSISQVESQSQSISEMDEIKASDIDPRNGYYLSKKPSTEGFIASESYDLNSDGSLETVHLINLDALYLQVDEVEPSRIERVEIGKLILEDAFDLKIEMNKKGNILVSYYYKGNGLPAGRQFLYIYYWDKNNGLSKVWDGSFYCEHKYNDEKVEFILDDEHRTTVDVSEKLENLNRFKNKIPYYVGLEQKNPKAEDVFKLKYSYVMTSLDFKTKEDEIIVKATYLAQTDFPRAEQFNIGIVDTTYSIVGKEMTMIFDWLNFLEKTIYSMWWKYEI